MSINIYNKVIPGLISLLTTCKRPKFFKISSKHISRNRIKNYLKQELLDPLKL